MFDAVVLADSPHAREKLLGLTLAERGRRVAAKTGARRVMVVDGPEARGKLADWDRERAGAGLLVLRAGDQVVHKPLVEPLLAGSSPRRIAVGPDGTYAGALWAQGDAASEAVAAVSAGDADAEIAKRWADAEKIAHGDIARHDATSPDERAGASRMLQRLNIKKEDNPVTRYCYRPLSKPLTRILVHTPITPNQISYLVGILGVLGCVITAMPGQTNLIVGAAVIFFAGVLDGCDGEIARLKLLSSPYGAWLDTVVDEITTTGYFIAIAAHVYAHASPEWAPYVWWSIPIGTLSYVASIYAIYYYCVVVAKVGGSQFYIGTLDVVESEDAGGGKVVGLRPRPRSPKITSPLLRTLGAWAIYVKTRDFINLAALGLTLFDAYWVIYVPMFVGGVITAVIIMPEHVRLLGQLREVRRRGGTPQLV